MSEPALSSVFRDAAGQGKLAEVQRTLRQGVNVNAVDEDGNTALHRAADKGHMESEWGGDGATRRRAHGADTDLKHELGNTALHYAARNDHMEMVTASSCSPPAPTPPQDEELRKPTTVIVGGSPPGFARTGIKVKTQRGVNAVKGDMLGDIPSGCRAGHRH